jgi:hypothetical protein
MPDPQKNPAPDNGSVQFDSLNCDNFEPTNVEIDNTVRPMSDSLRKYLKLPPYNKPPTDQPPQAPGPDKPSS